MRVAAQVRGVTRHFGMTLDRQEFHGEVYPVGEKTMCSSHWGSCSEEIETER
jgi:hypothetical protein